MSTLSILASDTRSVADHASLSARIAGIKALIMDWDGVFNNGFKDIDGGSPFSEVGSMGVNLVRFSLWLKWGQLPTAGIITGQVNPYAERFAKRERLHATYMGFSNKPEAFDAFLKDHHLKAEEVAFIFDDVLDLPVAARCGLRIMIASQATSWLVDKAVNRELADLITATSGGENGLREATDAIIALIGNGEEVLDHRIGFTDRYQRYLRERQAVEPRFVQAQ